MFSTPRHATRAIIEPGNILPAWYHHHVKVRTFKSEGALEAWFRRNHEREPELWLKIYKKASGMPTVTPAQALDVALCWGWIDGIRKAFDVWVGSMPALLAAAVLGGWALDGADRVLMMIAAAVYFLCVQLPTFAINIPLNNALQKLDADAMKEPARNRARDDFEARWDRWNVFRTGFASVTSFALLWLLLRVTISVSALS